MAVSDQTLLHTCIQRLGLPVRMTRSILQQPALRATLVPHAEERGVQLPALLAKASIKRLILLWPD
jgi:hypothetical protein